MRITLNRTQRGDSDLWSLIILCVLCYVLFSGKPSVLEGMQKWAHDTAGTPPAVQPEPKREQKPEEKKRLGF